MFWAETVTQAAIMMLQSIVFILLPNRSASGFSAASRRCSGCRCSAVLCYRIDRVEKRKPVEVRVSGVNRLDPILSHQDRGMRVKDQIAGNSGDIGEDFRCHMAMPIGFRQEPQAWGGK